MTSAFLALGLGIVASLITSGLKKWKPEMDARITQLAVLGVCFILAIATQLVIQYAPAEIITLLGTSFAVAVAWYEVAMKKHE